MAQVGLQLKWLPPISSSSSVRKQAGEHSQRAATVGFNGALSLRVGGDIGDSTG
jgi:hypothetical protein